MDTPYEDRQWFSHVTVLLSVSSAEISTPGSLTLDTIQQVSSIHTINTDFSKASVPKAKFDVIFQMFQGRG